MCLRRGFCLPSMRRHPYDPRYEEDAYEPMSDQEFDVLVGEPDGRWTTWLL